MKQRFLLFLLVFFIQTLVIKATNYYVATNGSDSNNGTSTSTPFATIQEAITTASSGNDVIYIMAGTYNQMSNISSKSGITITNYNGASVILDGTGASYTVFFMISNASNVTISGLTMQNLGIGYARGIYVYETTAPASSNLTFSNNTFKEINSSSTPYTTGYTNPNSGANAILVAGGINNTSSAITNVTITGNTVEYCELGYSEGISVKGNVNGFLIANNTVQDVTDIGIDAAGLESWPTLTIQSLVAQNGVIRNNTLINCIDHRSGSDNGALYVDGGSNINILYNTLTRNKFGINIGCENQTGYSNAAANNIQVRDNYLYNNTLSGILCGTNGAGTVGGYVTNSVIEGNTLYMDADSAGSYDGELYLQYNTNLLIRDNIFYIRSQNGSMYQMGNYGTNISGLTLGYNDYYPGGSSSGVCFSDANRSWDAYSIANMESTYGISDPGSIYGNPALTSYQISTSSPCVNAGDPNLTILSGETDYAGDVRVQGGRVDIGCYETGGTVTNPTGVSVSPTSASISVNGTEQLTATVTPSGANQSVTWSSSNTGIATVSSSGLVTGVAAGSATITATTTNNLTATCAITVTSITPTGVTVSPTSASISVNGTQQLTATVTPSGANQSVTWSSSNTGIATVNSSGLVTGVAAGNATITATTTNNLTATCAITVTSSGGALPSPWQTLDIGSVGATGSATYSSGVFTVNGSGADIYGNTDAFRFVYQPLTSNGQIAATVTSLTNTNGWAKVGVMIKGNILTTSGYALCAVTPSNGVILETYDSTTNVTSQLQVTGITAPQWVELVRSGTSFTGYYSSNGTSWTTIGTATINGMATNCQIGLAVTSHDAGTLCTASIDNVTLGTTAPTGVSVSPTSASISVNGTQQITATVTPSNANQSVTWSSSNTSVATVNSSGLVTGVAAGSATITATTTNNLTATCAITVTAVTPTGVTVSPTSASISVNGTQQLTATVTPSGANQSVTWSSSNTGIATVNSSGLVTGVAAGNATITATTTNNLTATCAITVTSSGGALPSPWQTLDIGSVGATGSATYSSGVFTVNGSGADIYGNTDAFRFVYQPLTSNGQIAATVTSLTNTNGWAKAGVMIKGNILMSSGYAFCAITPSNGVILETYDSTTNVTSQLQVTGITAPRWVELVRSGTSFTGYYSSNGTSWTTIGTATVNGMATNCQIGLAVTSHDAGTLCTASIDNVTLGTTAPTGVSVSPTSASISVNGTEQLTATVTPSGANQTVTWSSSNTGIATVSSSGLVTGVAAGSATITATTTNNLTATCAITVTSITPTGVTVSPTSASISVNGTQQLTATVTPSGANQSVTWSSSNIPVATVSSSGLVTGVSAGTATITVTTINGYTANCAITVTSGSGALPSPWQTLDIGSVGATGSATYSSGVFTVNGSGWDIYGNTDAFRFVYQPLTTNAQINATVTSMTNPSGGSGWSKAGVMIKGNVLMSSGYALCAVTPSNGVILETYDSTTNVTSQLQVTGIAAPQWVGLVRSGTSFTGYYSSNGTTWTTIGTATVKMQTNCQIGLAVTSHDAGVLCTASIDNVTVTANGNSDVLEEPIDASKPLPLQGENTSADAVNVYPNPAIDVLNINLGDSAGMSVLRIYNLEGMLLYQGQTYDHLATVNMASLNINSGMVLVQVTKNGQVSNFKVVIH